MVCETHTATAPRLRPLIRPDAVGGFEWLRFALALGERVRARVEDAGRVELDDAEASALARTKAVHVALLVLAVRGGVWSRDRYVARGLVFSLFMLRRPGGGVCAGCGRGGDCQARGQGTGGGGLWFFHVASA